MFSGSHDININCIGKPIKEPQNNNNKKMQYTVPKTLLISATALEHE